MNALPAPAVRSPPAVQARRVARRDTEFLPAAIAILEAPASPLRSVLSLTICALAAAAVAWCLLGRIDIIATAPGKLQPVGLTKTVQPLETGKVRAILAENGRAVRAGDVLILLDAGEAQADEAALTSERASLQAEALRRRLAIAAITAGTGATWPADTGSLPREAMEREHRVLDSELARLNALTADLRAQIAEKLAGRDRLKSTIAAQQQLMALLRQQVDMRVELLARNAESKARVLEAQGVFQNQVTALASQQGQLAEMESAVEVARREIDKAVTGFLAENSEKLAEAERQVGILSEKLAKARLRTEHMVIRSPVAGVVQGLSVTTIGQVVEPGEHMMQIVPDHPRLEIECYLSNADIAFVQPGQSASVKIESLPFTSYGTLEARVSRVARDAIAPAEAADHSANPAQPMRGASFGGAEPMRNLVFPVTLTPEATALRRHGTDFPLTPGMSVTVEIRTGSRRIADFLFAPLMEISSSAMHER